MVEKYGFVYLWRDRKHNRYYIGSHWGTEDDNYICSSRWMRKSYNRRKEDFKRRIITRIYTNRKDLLEEEHRYLSMIKPEELKGRYYNISLKHFGHWSSDENSRLTIGQKISKSHARPEIKERMRVSKLGDNNPMKRKEVAEAHSKKMKGKPAWNKGLTKDDPRVQKYSEGFGERMKGRIPHNKGKKYNNVTGTYE